MKYFYLLLLVLGFNGSVVAQTDNFDVARNNLQGLLGDDKIERIVEIEKSGFLEVVTKKGIFYTNKTGTLLFEGGRLVDVKTRENLTDKVAFVFNEIPLKNALKVVRGDGSRKIITFEDPNCGWCRRFMAETNKLTNVTVYTFVVPVLGEDSKVKAKSILCSANPTKTWIDFMSIPNYALERKDCDVSFEESLKLMQKLRIRGTPGILFESNTKAPGFMTSDKIEAKMKEMKG